MPTAKKTLLKTVQIGICLAGFILAANGLYYVKSRMGIKLTRQPHHGWLFPIADHYLKQDNMGHS